MQGLIDPKQKKIEQEQKAVFVDKKVQEALNAPLADPSGLSDEDQKFLELFLALVEEGKVNLYAPSSLINQSVYESLNEKQKGKVEIDALNILNTLREIKYLHDAGQSETFQFQNMVEKVRNIKERLENEGGDLFII